MKIKFTQKEKDEIYKAVEAAEEKTSGEISTAVIKESSDYILFEFLFMISFGIFAGILLLIFGPQWQSFWNSLSWTLEPFQLSSISIATVFIVMGLAYLLANTPFMDRIIVPKRVMARMVYQKAIYHFFNAGLTNTTDRTAVLIFISLNERRVELIADKGISDKIEAEVWQSIVDKLIGKIVEGKTTNGLIEAIEECGKILKKEFPQPRKVKDQLSNSVQILED